MPLEQQASEINKKDQYLGVVQLIERGIWDAEAESLSLSTRTIYSCSQKARQWTLTPRFVGSNPATSASRQWQGCVTQFARVIFGAFNHDSVKHLDNFVGRYIR